MKSLSLSQPLLLIVIGAPGAGKTYFARQFAQTFAAPLVSFDEISSQMPNTLTEKETHQVSTALAQQQSEQLVKTQKTFLMDGVGSSRADRARWRKMAQSHGYETLLVWVQTDESTAKYRSMSRNGKRVDDTGRTAINEEEFSKRTKHFTAPLPTEAHVVISGKHTYATQAKVVLKKLVGSREASMRDQPIVSVHPRPLKGDSHQPSPQRGYLIR